MKDERLKALVKDAWYKGVKFGRSLAITGSYTPTDKCMADNFEEFYQALHPKAEGKEEERGKAQ